MVFKELETKQMFDNSYGNSVWIDRYVYYNGTEQISIYVKKGYGADERVINVVISEHDLTEWIANFKSSVNLPNSATKPLLTEKKTSVNLPKIKDMNEETTVVQQKNNFDSMREILFDSMSLVKEGKLDIDKAKAVSMICQTIINSVKVEIDYIQATDTKHKLSMIE